MFRGVNTLNLDAKGRLAIPTRYRDGLIRQTEGRMVVTINNTERCLWLYPLIEWEVIERKLVNLPSSVGITPRSSGLLWKLLRCFVSRVG